MQLYVLDRSKNVLATTSSQYNDKHHKELTAGVSSFEFDLNKSDEAAQYMVSGNYITTLDDQGRPWSFTILYYDEYQLYKTIYCEDVGIELYNKACDIWYYTEPHPFEYYLDLLTDGTPWELGVNQLSNLSRTLNYTGRDTGLGRLLSVLKAFDGAECIFNIQMNGPVPVKYVIDVYKKIGTVQDNIQIAYNEELDNIQKTETRQEFVTALSGVGSVIQNTETDADGSPVSTDKPQEYVDFKDLEFDNGSFYTTNGDKFIRARTANQQFNPGDQGYIEDFYEYDTKSSAELFNRTLTQIQTRSQPQFTYEADVKVIDPSIDIGDTVTIIDHDYNPALYLQARVATLEKSYTDTTKGSITFTNYVVLTDTVTQQIAALKSKVNGIKNGSSSYVWIRYADDDQGTGISQSPKDKTYVAILAKINQPVPSDDPNDYAGHWVRIAGEDGLNGQMGPQGHDGADGIPGKDGRTSYTHIAYANSADGATGFSVSESNRTYIGMYVDFTATDSDDHTKYAWTLVKGADGAQGIPGKAGADGRTPYLHIAYADNANGTEGFSTTDSLSKLYIGQYTDFVQADSTDPASYAWTLIKGDKGDKGDTGADGLAGKDGVSIKSTVVTYQLGTSGTTQPTNNWSSTVPTLVKGQYLWTKTTWNYSDNTTEDGFSVAYIAKDGSSGADGLPGKDGTGIKSTVIEYAVSSNGITKPSAGWSATVPSVAAGQFMWTRTTWSYTDGTNEVGYSVAQAGKNGERGKQIFKSNYESVPHQTTHYWSDLSPAVSVDNPPKIGDTVITPAGNILQIDTVIVGGGGGGGTFGVGNVLGNIKGPSGTDGKPGKDGVGIKTTVITYAISTSGTTAPTTSWTSSVPSLVKGQYLWTKTVWTYTDNSFETGYSVTYISKDGNNGSNGLAGKDGTGIKTTTITYAGSTSGTTAPTSGWTSTVPAVAAGSYLWTKTVWAYTDNTSETGYSVAMMGVKGDTGVRGLQGLKGDTGIKGPAGMDGKTSYTHIAYANSATGEGFNEQPGGKTYIGVYVDFDVTDSTDVTKYNWSLVKGNDGANGTPGKAGADGKTPYLHVAYSNSADGVTDFTTDNPDGKKFAYLGTYTDYTQADPTDHTKYLWSLVKGEAGANGKDGQDAYLHIAYANSVDGKTNFTTDQSQAHNRDYLGTYSDNTKAQSTDPTKYTWQLTRGAQGLQGQPGSKDVPVVTMSSTAPSNPKNGDFWYQTTTDASGQKITGFSVYSNGKWVPSKIDQSTLVLTKLVSVEIDSATINSPDITVPFDYFDEKQTEFKGSMEFKDGMLKHISTMNGGGMLKTVIGPTGYTLAAYANQSEYTKNNPYIQSDVYADNIGFFNTNTKKSGFFDSSGIGGGLNINTDQSTNIVIDWADVQKYLPEMGQIRSKKYFNWFDMMSSSHSHPNLIKNSSFTSSYDSWNHANPDQNSWFLYTNLVDGNIETVDHPTGGAVHYLGQPIPHLVGGVQMCYSFRYKFESALSTGSSVLFKVIDANGAEIKSWEIKIDPTGANTSDWYYLAINPITLPQNADHGYWTFVHNDNTTIHFAQPMLNYGSYAAPYMPT